MKIRKQKARLKARQEHFKATQSNNKNARTTGVKEPGSMNPHKSFPVKRK